MILCAMSATACSRHDGAGQAQREKDRDRQARLAKAAESVRALVAKTGADTTWKSELLGEGFNPLKRIYSIDVARVWRRGRPILMVGHLDDVSSDEPSTYKLTVRASEFLGPSFELEVTCSQETARAAVDAARSDRDNFMGGGVALAAHVAEVKSFLERDDEGRRHVFIGYGKCIDVAYVGEIDNVAVLLERLPRSRAEE